MIPNMTKEVVLALAAAALAGCAAGGRNACDGLVYSDSGLTREQFRPCAAEMVKQLDRAQSAIQVMADKTRTRVARTEARQECLSATADLSRLLRSAGGSRKLLARWDDTRLNELSLAVISAEGSYAMVCYYGPKPFEQAGAPQIATIDSNHERARQILAEIR